MATFYRYQKHNADRSLVLSSKTKELIGHDYTNAEEKFQFRRSIDEEAKSRGKKGQDIIGVTTTDIQSSLEPWINGQLGKNQSGKL
jgi:hypothetical protein